MKRALAGMLIAGLVAIPAVATWAHHSFAMFDRTRTVMLRGVVRQFQWANPHAWIQVWAEPANGKPAGEWSVEAGSINMMIRQGWHSHTLHPGDKVAMVVHPILSGAPSGSLVSITLAGGQVLGPGGAPAPRAGNAPPP